MTDQPTPPNVPPLETKGLRTDLYYDKNPPVNKPMMIFRWFFIVDLFSNQKHPEATSKAQQKAKHVDDKFAKYNGRRRLLDERLNGRH